MLLRIPRYIDQAAYMHRLRDLNEKARSAYWELSLHYWERGRLPKADRDLAAVSKLSVVSFRNLKVQIAWAFDGRDSEGRWRDYDLEAERDEAIRGLGHDPADFLEPAIQVPPDGAATHVTPRSRAGSLNAKKRWAEVHAAKARDANGIGLASAVMPNPMPNAMPNRSVGMADGTAVARSHSAFPSGEEEEKELDSESSSSKASPLSDANANATGPNASHGTRMGSAGGIGDLDLAALERKHGVSGDEIRRVVAESVGVNKIGFDLTTPDAIEPVWRLIEEGCDLRLDIAPALTFCRTLKNRLAWLGADFIAPRCRANRDRPNRPASAATVQGGLNNVWIPRGSDKEKAWKAFEQGRPDAGKWLNQPYRGQDKRFKGTTGWWRSSEWPPVQAPETTGTAA